MNQTDERLLNEITDGNIKKHGAYNIRKNGKVLERQITDDVIIESKEDGTGINIKIKEDATSAFVYIPVIVTESGLEDVVYNDFFIGKNANAVIVAGCGIHNDKEHRSRHLGIHRFFLEEGSNVKYLEKHYGEGHGKGDRILDPVTEVEMKKGSIMTMDTVQIKGVSTTDRKTVAKLQEDTTLTIKEKIMTAGKETAKTDFYIEMNGKGSSCHVTSRSVAVDESSQIFISNVLGNEDCYAHVECDAIIKDSGKVKAIPEVDANHVDARLIHEATIGKIAGDELTKLMSLGLTSEEAEEEIIKGFLR